MKPTPLALPARSLLDPIRPARPSPPPATVTHRLQDDDESPPAPTTKETAMPRRKADHAAAPANADQPKKKRKYTRRAKAAPKGARVRKSDKQPIGAASFVIDDGGG